MTHNCWGAQNSACDRAVVVAHPICAFHICVAGGRLLLKHGLPENEVTENVGRPRRKGPSRHLLIWFPASFVAGRAAGVACDQLYALVGEGELPVAAAVHGVLCMLYARLDE